MVMATLVHQVIAWVVQAVWPGSSQLLGWFIQGLVSCLDGSGCGFKSVVQAV